MIKGMHGMFYSADADATRAFMRDKLQLTCGDVGGGWLIFALPECDMGVHPVEEKEKGSAGTHNISFYCDDIETTVAELRGRGVEFAGPVEDHGYGLVTRFAMPGGVNVQLYQPRYEKPKAK
jgi:catechol 2,3-dioxygenase-like lactoylglutathione lyase family enzyme